MNNRKLVIGMLTVLSLTLSINGIAKTKNLDRTVQYKNQNIPYCNVGLTLLYGPYKDNYFCSGSSDKRPAAYVYLNKRARPYCKKPYKLTYLKERSRYFKSKPTCKK